MAVGYAVEPVGQRRHNKYSSKYRLILPETYKIINFILQLPTLNMIWIKRLKEMNHLKWWMTDSSVQKWIIRIISPVSLCSETFIFLPSRQFLSWSSNVVFITNYNILLIHVQQAYHTNYLRTNRSIIILPQHKTTFLRVTLIRHLVPVY